MKENYKIWRKNFMANGNEIKGGGYSGEFPLWLAEEVRNSPFKPQYKLINVAVALFMRLEPTDQLELWKKVDPYMELESSPLLDLIDSRIKQIDRYRDQIAKAESERQADCGG
jgi:hypothetical protein